MFDDHSHSTAERRWHALGKTNEQRLLHLTFTMRANGARVRIISARPIKVWLAERVFVGSDRREGDVARGSKRLLGEHAIAGLRHKGRAKTVAEMDAAVAAEARRRRD